MDSGSRLLGAVSFDGRDAVTFLQGYLTSDVERLDHATVQASAVCNLQGRVVANGWCARAEHGVTLFIHASMVDPLMGFLEKYLVFAKCQAADVSSRVALSKADSTFRLKLASTDSPVESDFTDQTALLHGLTANGFLLVSATISETYLPQALGLTRLEAVSFTKGCYLGQEIVARAQHRGQVKRTLMLYRWQGSIAPVVGEPVTIDGKAIGMIVQSATDPDKQERGLVLVVTKANPPSRLQFAEADYTQIEFSRGNPIDDRYC